MTNGHLDVVRASASMVDRLVLAVGIHPGKVPLFAAEERIAMLEEVCAPVARAAGCEIAFLTFADLVITAAQRAGATILIRGVRDGTDFDYEMQMAGMNAVMAPEVQTIFLPASPTVRPITATRAADRTSESEKKVPTATARLRMDGYEVATPSARVVQF